MSDRGEFDLDAYGTDKDAYRAVRDENVAHIGNHTLQLHLAIAPDEVIRPIYERRPSASEAEIRREYTETVETSLGEADPTNLVAPRAEPWGGPKTGGPIPDQTYAVQLVGLALGGMGSIVVIAEFIGVVQGLIKKAKELTRHDVAVSDGVAVVLAADAIFQRTGKRDLALAFVTPLNEYLPQLDEMDSPFDGWLIGFRSSTELQIAHVDRLGGVSVPESRLPIDWSAL